MGIKKESEESFQNTVIQFARLFGWRHFHVRDSRGSEPGFVDLVLVRRDPPGVLFLELKTETGVVAREQAEWLDDLAAAGAVAKLIRPSDWQELEELLRRPS